MRGDTFAWRTPRQFEKAEREGITILMSKTSGSSQREKPTYVHSRKLSWPRNQRTVVSKHASKVPVKRLVKHNKTGEMSCDVASVCARKLRDTRRTVARQHEKSSCASERGSLLGAGVAENRAHTKPNDFVHAPTLERKTA